MYVIGDEAADIVIREISERADKLEKIIRSMRGAKYARDRKKLRAVRYDLRCIIAGLNTGEGVTRASARSEQEAPDD